ncbi:MAG: ribonuclease P protein component [Anaerolineae bacterium]
MVRRLRLSHRMRKKYRLRTSADFERLRQEGQTWVHPLLILSTLPNGLLYNRFGFIVGRRLGRATQRNRIKRRMREAVRLRIQKGEIVTGWDLVFVARYPIQQATFHQIYEAVGVLMRRAGLISEGT